MMLRRKVLAPIYFGATPVDRSCFGLDLALGCIITRCRDEFFQIYYFHRNLFYILNHSPYQNPKYEERINRIDRFFMHIEDLLGWKSKTKIHPTQHKNIIYIKPSSNWTNPCFSIFFTQNARNKRMRRSLFTALLRCSEYYDGDGSYNDIIQFAKKTNYLKRTLPAFKAFLVGKQYYEYRKCKGWCDAFFKIDRPMERLINTKERTWKQWLVDLLCPIV